MYVLAFDRDWTVDVNPHPDNEAVPLEWVRHWAHATAHEVWAIGNQDLVEEADIPGTVESIRRRDGDLSALGDQDGQDSYEWWPARAERLAILADLFPDADRYIVVDDLDLAHVDGWDHYHAWEFVPAVRQGDLDLEPPAADTPPSAAPVDSEAAVRAILQAGYLFELTHREEGEERTHLVSHVEPKRPSMTPLRGPPTFWFEPLGGDEPVAVRLPDLVALQPVPYERVPEPLTSQALATLAAVLETDPDHVPLEEIHTALADARKSGGDHQLATALLLARRVLQSRDDAFDAIAEPTFALLHRTEVSVGNAVLRLLAGHAETHPEDLEPYVTDLVSLITDASAYRLQATRCLLALAEATPGAAVDAVPALATVAEAAEGDPRSVAIYTLSLIAAEYPDHVAPAIEPLVAALRAPDETIQANASTALGHIAGAYPDAAEPLVAELVALLDADAKRVRNNAAGLLADVAQEHPAAVIDHTDALAARLDDPNIQARINASIALLRAGAADPAAIRSQHARLAAALDDASPEVRANVCALIGNAEVPVAVSRLRALRATDPDETVRDRAAWALQRLA